MSEQKARLEIIYLPLSEIQPYTNNNKIHSDEQIDKLALLMDAYGPDQPIVVDSNKVIIKGEGRFLAAKRLNWETYPCYIAKHLDENQTKANRIADNKVSSLDYDMEKMRFEIGTLERANFDLNLTGLGFEEIDELLKMGELSMAPPNKDRPAEEYENSEVRQIVLIMDKEQFESMLGDFSRLMKEFEVETNMAVVRKLIESYGCGTIAQPRIWQ